MNIHSGTLTSTAVSIDSEAFGTRAYCNSPLGRAQFEGECTSDIVKEVYDAWGDAATLEDPVPPEPSAPQPTEEQKQLAAMALHQAQTDTTITELQQANAALMLKVAGGN